MKLKGQFSLKTDLFFVMHIKLHDHNFSSEDIQSLHIDHRFNDYEKRIIRFIKDWIEGKTVFYQQTSGSTGKPDTISINRQQMEYSAKMTIDYLNLTAEDRFFNPLNIDYIGGKMMLVRAALLNADIIINTPSGLPLEKIKPDEKLDFAAFVPLQIQNIIENASDYISKLNTMKSIIVGGAPLSHYQEKLIRQYLKVPVYHTYGMTETISHIAMRPINAKDRSYDYNVLPGIEIDKDKRGCLNVKGKITNNKVIQSNDIVEFTSANSFKWKGRYDHIINSGGIKIYPEELERKIEDILTGHKYNIEFFLWSISDKNLGEQLIMICKNNQFDKQVITNLLKDHLPKYHVPRQIFSLPHFQLTSSGKIDKKETVNLLKIK